MGIEMEVKGETVEQMEESTTQAELEEVPGELEQLQEELEKTRAQAAEYLDGWQRVQAEFSNYKKRQEVERAQMWMQANIAVLLKILPVLDDFERALVTLPADLSQQEQTWWDGILMIKAKLDGILESEGVRPIVTEGQSFDPLYHEAVTYEEASGYEEGQIVGEAQRGYMIADRVLRPALVRVAKAPAPLSEGEGDGSDNDA